AAVPDHRRRAVFQPQPADVHAAGGHLRAPRLHPDAVLEGDVREALRRGGGAPGLRGQPGDGAGALGHHPRPGADRVQHLHARGGGRRERRDQGAPAKEQAGRAPAAACGDAAGRRDDLLLGGAVQQLPLQAHRFPGRARPYSVGGAPGLRASVETGLRGYSRGDGSATERVMVVEAEKRWYLSPGTEQGLLRISITVVVAFAALGVVLGLLSHSFAIIFDGVYSLIDACMTVVGLLVVRLIAASNAGGLRNMRLIERFTMGFWHLEPIVLGVDALLLTGAAVYALINAIGSLAAGGREVHFDMAVAYAALTTVASFAMWRFQLRANRRIRSSFVALDSKGWLMSCLISGALLVAFAGGLVVQDTRLDWVTPYIDPAVLALVCLVIIPIPMGTIRQALADILLVTPADLKHH